MEFEFTDPGVLDGGDFQVVLTQTTPPDPERGVVPAYGFRVHVADQRQHIGRVNLRIGFNEHVRLYAGNLGYAIDPGYRGRKLAERAVGLILPIARAHGMNELWIGCSPENWASRKTCERLGAELVEIIAVPAGTDLYERGNRENCHYLLRL